MTKWIWGAAALFYAAFLGWYVNWSGALTAEEIDQYMARAEQNGGAGHTDPHRTAKLHGTGRRPRVHHAEPG